MRAASVLGLLLLTSLALRWPLASHDVEHYIGPDEGEVVENVLEMLKTGDLDHRHPGYPGLHFYIQMLPASARLLVEERTIPELPRAGFYLLARRTTLLAGVLTGAVAFALALRILPPFWSAVAAGLVVLSPLGTRESAVVNPDLMLSLFVGLSLWASLRALEQRTWSRFFAAGALVGLASAVKYTGAFTVLPYLLAFLLGADPSKHRGKGVTGLVAALAAFLLASPYTFLNLAESLRGLGMHVGYYRASDMNAALELARVLFSRGLGAAAGLAAIGGAALALRSLDPRRLVVLGYPVLYLLAFAFFDRAFPRHALPLLAPLAILAVDAVFRVGTRIGSRSVSAVLALGLLAQPLVASVSYFRRAQRPTPADRAARWLFSELPPGSRILQDQFTPSLDPERFHFHRVRVEERVFVGSYDWVLFSGYPPVIDTTGLREVARFETDDALGDTILVYEVPDRGSLMPVSLPERTPRVEIGAGELPYFGEGFDAATPGAFGTERLSRGESSELFFVLPRASGPEPLVLELRLAAAAEDFVAAMGLELNGRDLGTIEVSSGSPQTIAVPVSPELLERGLNRLVLGHARTVRLDRRHPDAAVRVYGFALTRE